MGSGPLIAARHRTRQSTWLTPHQKRWCQVKESRRARYAKKAIGSSTTTASTQTPTVSVAAGDIMGTQS
jgi:hypothetical protein